MPRRNSRQPDETPEEREAEKARVAARKGKGLKAKADEKPTIGRPSDYYPEIGEDFCARMCEGRSLRDVCSDEDMPGTSTVFRWLRLHEPFREQYARAFEGRADAIFEEMFEIADDGRNDWMAKNDPENAGYVFNGEAARRAQLRIDARKWALSRMKPDRYGDKMKLDATVTVRDMDTATLLAQAKALREKLGSVIDGDGGDS